MCCQKAALSPGETQLDFPILAAAGIGESCIEKHCHKVWYVVGDATYPDCLPRGVLAWGFGKGGLRAHHKGQRELQTRKQSRHGHQPHEHV